MKPTIHDVHKQAKEKLLEQVCAVNLSHLLTDATKDGAFQVKQK